jgi:hypothetical protein
MGIKGDSMLSPTLINCNFVKPAQGLTAAIFIVAFKKDDGTLSAGGVTAEWDQAANVIGCGGAILRR